MTIQEIKIRKRSLEETVKKLLNDFEKETQTLVDNTRYDWFYHFTGYREQPKDFMISISI